ncbi:hypothetical protein P3X46_002423 [Hevea brasiliensis]|uniref:VWFA domain-containing protein n=1 Tax=Hevea brasiliensis TaxID=3981 RepID=A0ABQ9N2W9_HEVBR|nr:hypothetical protein P3X46_002423 [Hevea brasiliensis]
MGIGWRRAFCTVIPRDPDATSILDKQQTSPSPSPRPRSYAKLGTMETPSTNQSPVLYHKTAPRAAKNLNPSSPQSPIKLSLFKNSFKFSVRFLAKLSCGICLNSVKTDQGTTIYTAECAYTFQFPYVAAHVSKHGSLVFPVYNSNLHSHSHPQNDAVHNTNAAINSNADSNSNYKNKPKHEQKKVFAVESSLRLLLSPTAGSRFIPIPEADENAEEEEVDDMIFRSMATGILEMFRSDCCIPEAAVVSVGHGYEAYVMELRVKARPPPQQACSSNTAPLLDSSHQALIDLVTVLDVSGSMIGAKFVGDALGKVTKVLEDRRERNPVARIMLLFDGQDERVQTNLRNQWHASCHVSFTRFAHIKIPVHAFVFGQNGDNSHEPTEDAFAKCTREMLVELRVPSSVVGSHHVVSEVVYGRDQSLLVPHPRPHAVRSLGPEIERLRNHFISTRAITEARKLVGPNDFTSTHQHRHGLCYYNLAP